VGTGDLVIVDGTAGLVIINPEPQTVSHYRARARRELSERVLVRLFRPGARPGPGVRRC